MTPGKRFCYHILADQYDDHGYIPSVVTEGEPGHSPLTGDPAKLQTPWHWGKTYEDALRHCTEMNARLGLSQDDVAAIIMSSMYRP